MKRTIKVIILAVLTAATFLIGASCALPDFLSGCGFNCDSTSAPTPKPTPPSGGNNGGSSENGNNEWQGLFAGEFTFEIVKDKGFYYPTVAGELKTEKVPDKLTVVCNDTEREVALDTINKVNGYYVITFNQRIIYGYLTAGDHEATLKAYFGSGTKVLDEKTTLNADDDYSSFVGVDMTTGESLSAMDKESNWIGPYNLDENELPLVRFI